MRKYTYMLLAISMILFTAQSCFQDLGQNPPFDYPEEPPKPPISEDGQIFYMAFNDNYKDVKSNKDATKIGNPTFAEGKVEKAYAGAKDGYLTFKLSDLSAPLGSAVSVGFWYKVNGNPDRAGLVVIGPVSEGASANAQNNRTSGFRIFRENAGGKQRIKANVGNGTADAWLDGGEKGDIDPTISPWKYITLVLTEGKAFFYIDGEEVASSDLSKISWAGCDIMSIGSGEPRFNEWGHLSDNSLIDELRIYNRALTAAQIKDIVNHDTE
ncbi:LamG domain-containing protein [Petrimonas sp.]|uniref:LamG domain-containing protein n=1 Tax=Petrimonas sp. TaxID=2023866 RepID=UPI003F5151D6